ncbi:MAG: hypothetical protein AAGA28_15735 [Pseudomonadota bacterium]
MLVFDTGRHELSCQACGAPLHEMKFVPLRPDRKRKNTSKKRKPKAHPPRPGASGRDRPRARWQDAPARHRRKPRRTPVMREVLEEMWELVEDIFD